MLKLIAVKPRNSVALLLHIPLVPSFLPVFGRSASVESLGSTDLNTQRELNETDENKQVIYLRSHVNTALNWKQKCYRN